VRRSFGVALGLGLACCAAAPAQAAQEVVVTGLDALAWDKPIVDIQPGDTMRWTFAGTTQVHNVKSTGPNWPVEFRSELGPIPAPDSPPYTFDAVGEYAFVCEVHAGMTGVVRVSEVPPPPAPPPPLSAQPFLNDSAAPFAPETAVALDTAKPGLSALSARRVANGARVRFKVSEESVVSVAVKRGRRLVKSVDVPGTGARSVTVSGLRAGRYVVQVRATDLAGNRSKLRTLRVIVR
jgi:plastocyanin